MKQFNKEEYNRMCAEFLGYVNLTPDDPDFDFYEHPTEPVKLGEHVRKTLEPASMLFHKDWNWIMEVVDKISNWANANVEKYNSYFWGTEPKVDFLIFRLSKDNLVTAIWEFLNWYQEQSK